MISVLRLKCYKLETDTKFKLFIQSDVSSLLTSHANFTNFAFSFLLSSFIFLSFFFFFLFRINYHGRKNQNPRLADTI